MSAPRASLKVLGQSFVVGICVESAEDFARFSWFVAGNNGTHGRRYGQCPIGGADGLGPMSSAVTKWFGYFVPKESGSKRDGSILQRY